MDKTAVAPLMMMLTINDALMAKAVDGFTDAELWQRPTEHNNPPLWLLGHIVQSRATILKVLGEAIDTGWGETFRRGASIEDRPSVTVADIMARKATITERLAARYDAVDGAFLMGPATGPAPQVKTVADLLTFLTAHESYHVGQLAYIRKAVGQPGLIG